MLGSVRKRKGFLFETIKKCWYENGMKIRENRLLVNSVIHNYSTLSISLPVSIFNNRITPINLDITGNNR